MQDAFGVDREAIAKALANTPKALYVLNRYGNQVARTGGTGSRMGQAARARVAARQTAGQPAESLTRAFAGIGTKPKPAPSAAGRDAFTRAMNGATAKPKGPLPGPKPKPPTQKVVADLFAERGQQATYDAARAIRGRANTRRKLRRVGEVAGASAVGGGVALGASEYSKRKKGGRPHL